MSLLLLLTDRSESPLDKHKTMNQEFNDKIRELKIWARLDLDYCVQYRSAWLENDEDSKKRFVDTYCSSLSKDEDRNEFLKLYKKVKEVSVLHIQMDLCSMSLSTAIKQMEDHFEFTPSKILVPVAYYISSEILYEILKVINYLHTQDPPIIHRDVKPANILIKFDVNGRCIKLGDFGFAVLHEASFQTHTQNLGTAKYMAPEVRNSKKYSTKADVYSVGVITQRLFNFDINR